jgi:hypothetical protein
VSGTITLGSPLPAIANSSPGSLTIDGSGRSITVDGASLYQVLVVNPGTMLNLDALTIAHAHGTGHGGGIDNSGGTLTITNSTLANNSAGSGCAILNDGGSATVINSTFSGNSSGDGCGIANASNGSLSINNSTFSGNQANAARGGAIFLDSGTVNVSNSTFSGNTASSGADIYQSGGTITVTNSIFGNSAGGGNCSGAVANGGYNISDDATCGFGSRASANGQTIGDSVNPLLSASGLANNGGPTQTIALQPTSPAVDAIPVAQCPPTDQRGVARPDVGGTSCDIGGVQHRR